jgi:hypothetical protein
MPVLEYLACYGEGQVQRKGGLEYGLVQRGAGSTLEYGILPMYIQFCLCAYCFVGFGKCVSAFPRDHFAVCSGECVYLHCVAHCSFFSQANRSDRGPWT